MKVDDFVYPFIIAALVFMMCVDGCDHILLSLVDDNEKALRKRVNDLELRVIRIEHETKTKGGAK
ncbi:MAG: hypothetical protein IJI54_05790 [Kiritimatiellae bacterium]|nr:hypothetical protein [Kiritimatiellia bacterium]